MGIVMGVAEVIPATEVVMELLLAAIVGQVVQGDMVVGVAAAKQQAAEEVAEA